MRQAAVLPSFMGNDHLRSAIRFARNQILKRDKLDRNCPKRKHRPLYIKPFSTQELATLVDYSQSLLDSDLQNLSGPNTQRIALYDQVKTVITHEKLMKLLPQYRAIDGCHNVWVVKPSFNARGLGVYCANRMKDIIQANKKQQSKVVQKYIERPLLINKRKFDIR